MCNCNQTTTTTTICAEPVSCTCPILLSSDCTTNVTTDLVCSNILKGQTLNEVLILLDEFICTKFDSVTNFFDLINVGAGSQVYKGVSMLGKKEIRTLVDSGLINLVQGTNDITISVDEAALNTFIEANQKTYSATNIGTGANVYKDTTVVGDNTQLNLRKINTSNSGAGEEILKAQVENTNDISIIAKTISSTSLNITSTADEVLIEVLEASEIPSLIVNSAYTGIEELGTASKPFKNTQNALDAYVGNGVSNKVPELLGTVIKIQKDDNIFIGSLAYTGLNIEIANGATLVTNPTVGNYTIDIDSDAILPTNINYLMLPFSNTEEVNIIINIVEGGFLQAQKKLVKNRGTNIVSGVGKTVRFTGAGNIINIAESPVTSASTKNLFSLNEDNQVGFFNGGVTANAYVSTNINSENSQIAYIGTNSKLYLSKNSILFGAFGVAFNSNTIPFKINAGQIVADASDITNEYNNSPTYSLINLISIENGGYFFNKNALIGGVCEYIFANNDIGTSTTCQIILDNCTSISTQTEAVFKSFMSSGIWSVRLTNCNFQFWGVNSSKVHLIPGSINTLSSNVVETLPEYTSKANAVLAGLFTGCKFINKNDITAGAFVVGLEYKIVTVGSTDFTLIGATANTVGLYFTATGVGVGTGTASLIRIDTVI